MARSLQKLKRLFLEYVADRRHHKYRLQIPTIQLSAWHKKFILLSNKQTIHVCNQIYTDIHIYMYIYAHVYTQQPLAVPRI